MQLRRQCIPERNIQHSHRQSQVKLKSSYDRHGRGGQSFVWMNIIPRIILCNNKSACSLEPRLFGATNDEENFKLFNSRNLCKFQSNQLHTRDATHTPFSCFRPTLLVDSRKQEQKYRYSRILSMKNVSSIRFSITFQVPAVPSASIDFLILSTTEGDGARERDAKKIN